MAARKTAADNIRSSGDRNKPLAFTCIYAFTNGCGVPAKFAGYGEQ